MLISRDMHPSLHLSSQNQDEVVVVNECLDLLDVLNVVRMRSRPRQSFLELHVPAELVRNKGRRNGGSRDSGIQSTAQRPGYTCR